MSRVLSDKNEWIYREYNKILRKRKHLSNEDKSRIYLALHKKADRKFKREDGVL